MTKTLATAALTVAMFAGVAGASEAAQTVPFATVVAHLRDEQHVPAGELADAQKLVDRVYAQIGVQLVWTDGSAKLAAADGFRHIDVLIMNAEMTARAAAEPGVFGVASHRTNRASVFYPRLLAHALLSRGDPAHALAAMLAHEMGHVLLPEYSHAPSGIMQANWEGRIQRIPGFMPSQAATLRAMLTLQ